jgi:tetratricopeptide (TPR) repeat protein
MTSLTAAALLWSLSACAPTLNVVSRVPAPVNFGTANRLSIVQTEGRRSAREEIIGRLVAQARADGWFEVRDRTSEGIVLKVVDRNVARTKAQAANELFLRFDVYDWTTTRETREVDAKNDKGEAIKKRVTVYVAAVSAGVTITDATGLARVAEKDFKATAEADDDAGALGRAADRLVTRILRDITPRTVVSEVRLDKSDKGQRKLLKIARSGNVTAAEKELRAYLGAHPGNAAAQYNLAVMLDALGRYDEALSLYTQASASAGTRRYYLDAKAGCTERRASVSALSPK